MITLTHKDVNPRFRPLFSPIFHLGLGGFNGTSAIIGRCIARSTSTADMMNRLCTWDGVIQEIKGIEMAGHYDEHP
jgi:hypothetical protein